MEPILIFSTAYFPLVGGAEVAVREITSRLPETNFIVITARLRADLPEIEEQGNVLIHRIGIGNAWDKIRLIFSGPKVAATYKPKAIWSIMASYAGFAALFFKKKNPAVPYLLTLQEGDSFAHIYARVWWCWPWFKQIFTRANAIQTISNYLADWAKQLGGKNISVIPNGVPEFFFDYTFTKTHGWLRTQLGLRAEDVMIMSVSRLVPKNGIADLISALKFLPANTQLVLAGSGPLETELKNLADNIGKSKQVHFLGTVEYKELPEYLREADIFCRPSLSEGLGNAFLEAMAVNVPVIGTPVGGIPDFLHEGKTGYLCEPHNPESIAEAVKRVQADEALKKAVIQNAHDLVLAEFNWKKVSVRMGELFQKLV